MCREEKVPGTVLTFQFSTPSDALLYLLTLIFDFFFKPQLQKLKSTYVDGMISSVHNGTLQTHWDQTAAATGRLTSSRPNIQAVPKTAITIIDYQTNYIIGMYISS